VEIQIQKIPGVIQYNEVHFWAHTHQQLVGTIHILIDQNTNDQDVLKRVSSLFKSRGVSSLTVQINQDLPASQTPPFGQTPTKLLTPQMTLPVSSSTNISSFV
jgi:hypothetical protein